MKDTNNGNNKKKIAILIIILMMVFGIAFSMHFSSNQKEYLILQEEGLALGLEEYSDPNRFVKDETLENFQELIRQETQRQIEILENLVLDAESITLDIKEINDNQELTILEKIEQVEEILLNDLTTTFNESEKSYNDLISKDIKYNTSEKKILDEQIKKHDDIIASIDTTQYSDLLNVSEDLKAINKTITDNNTKASNRIKTEAEEAKKKAEEEAKKKAQEEAAAAAAATKATISNTTSYASNNTSSSSNGSTSTSSTKPSSPPPGCYEDSDSVILFDVSTENTAIEVLDLLSMDEGEWSFGGGRRVGNREKDPYCGEYWAYYSFYSTYHEGTTQVDHWIRIRGDGTLINQNWYDINGNLIKEIRYI